MYSNKLICGILKYINDNINKEITAQELSDFFYFDKTYIMKKFKKELGLTIHNYINAIRIYQSLDDFKSNDYILGIGIKHGFNSLEYFSETFKKVIGVSPITYKKFIFNRNTISIEDENIIINSILEINKIKIKIDDYLNREKPDNIQVKTIFKL